MTTESQAFTAGYIAREKAITVNPYPPGSPEHADWLAGHNQRDEELAW